MDPALFTASPGRLVPTEHGALAFVPPPLPPALGIGPALVAALDEASAAVGELAGVTRRLANPGLRG